MSEFRVLDLGLRVWGLGGLGFRIGVGFGSSDFGGSGLRISGGVRAFDFSVHGFGFCFGVEGSGLRISA